MPKQREVLLVDNLAFIVPQLADDAIDKFMHSVREGPTSLRVGIRATHSGVLTNYRVYPGMKVRDSVGSWVSEAHGGTSAYDAPVHRHHRAYGGGFFGSDVEDPLGRVVSAGYTQLVDDETLASDWKRPALSGMGSGYITLTADIKDPDAIQKILDGRYATVSSAQTSPSIKCNICGADFMDNGCEHALGNTYNVYIESIDEEVPVMCYAITDKLTYREISFVNIPARPEAQITKVFGLEKDDENCYHLTTNDDKAEIVSAVLCDRDGQTELIKGNEEMPKGKEKEPKKTIVAVPDAITNDDIEPDEVLEVSEPNPDTPVDSEVIQDNPPAKQPEELEEEAEVAAWDDEKLALANVARSLSQKDAGGLSEETSEELAKRLYSGSTDKAIGEGFDEHSHEMFVEIVDGVAYGYTIKVEKSDHFHIWEMKADGAIAGTTRSASSGPDHSHVFTLSAVDASEIPEFNDLQTIVDELGKIEENEEDAKISTEQRKKLSSSTFCGPNRSFPVPDCAHVTAARRLVGRWKGSPEAKARVKACVNRKANSLGCGGGASKDEVVPEPQKIEEPKQDCTDGAQAEITQLTAELDKARRTIVERDEDIRTLTTSLATAESILTKDLAGHLVTIRAILGKRDMLSIDSSEDWNVKVLEYGVRSGESLRDAINDLLPELDLAIRDGLRINKPILTPEKGKFEDSKVIRAVDKTNTDEAKKKTSIKKLQLGFKSGKLNSPDKETAGAEGLHEDLG